MTEIEKQQPASRLKNEPKEGKVLTQDVTNRNPMVIVLALIALFILAAAATAFYLTTLGI